MSNFNNIPIIVQQIAESMVDPSNPSNIKFNYQLQLENIRDYCILQLEKAKGTPKRKR